ncbi:MAG: hypothetical protein E5X53_31305 [Mesorhizobium sp.]|uniref:hypothetical protein n=1 Tax=Mesorhizobium sp. TaxID=1871066 RepID=UPI001226F4D1|nr:hypothetical protein [Mesorhizobium sp.]TIR48039.1 MAG: hypothetical protein E5X53_31305 [Mesorhizobium sp.]
MQQQESIPEISTTVASISSITSRLLSLVAEFSSIDREPREPTLDGDWLPLPDDDPQHQVGDYAGTLVDELSEALANGGWKPDPGAAPITLEETFSLGSIVHRAPVRIIARGFMEPVRRTPLVKRLPEQVVLYLIGIPGGRDFLEREQHGFGWHYHYLDARHRRSDIILCWDTRWKPPADPNNVRDQDRIRPLFQETHAEGSRDFPARPELWRDPKKESMYEACQPDLKRHISEFKCAADKAGIIWPPGKSLTPRSAVPMTASASLQRPRNKRR